MMIHQWTYPKAYDNREAEVQEILSRYPNDMFVVFPRMPRNGRAPGRPARQVFVAQPAATPKGGRGA